MLNWLALALQAERTRIDVTGLKRVKPGGQAGAVPVDEKRLRAMSDDEIDALRNRPIDADPRMAPTFMQFMAKAQERKDERRAAVRKRLEDEPAADAVRVLQIMVECGAVAQDVVDIV